MAVRWCEGLVDFPPTWMCEGCLTELHEQANGPLGVTLAEDRQWEMISLVDERPYAIVVVATKGEPGEAEPHRSAAPRRPRRTPRRGGVAV